MPGYEPEKVTCMKQRVLVLTASVGSGHNSAAAALEQIFRQAPGIAEVRTIDALALTGDTYRSLNSDLYFTMVRSAPWLIGWTYDYNDAPFKDPRIYMIWSTIANEPLINTIREYQPDITVCTHFLPAKIVSLLMARAYLTTRLSIVTTDFDFQGLWMTSHFNRYFVAIEETKVRMVNLGVPEERIVVSGIPVSSAFTQPLDRAAVLARYSLRQDVPIVLISAGAAGGDYAKEIVTQVMRMRSPFQAVVICGKNARLRQQIEALVVPQAERFRVLGFTREMPDLMRVAALFVGKPGGLSSAECMAAELPMVIINPIPGQEERNADHLLEAGAAVRCNYRSTVGFKIDRILGETGRLARMREGTRRLGKPYAAEQIVATVLDDTLEPLVLSEAEQQLMSALATGEAPPLRDVEDNDSGIVLYDERTGVALGSITPEQLGALQLFLVQGNSEDRDYYVNQVTVDLLRQRGVDPALVALLEQAIGETGEADIRWAQS